MDELELLKKDWNKQSAQKKLSAKELYPMLHKKSSSIVKTLFYISIAELVFWVIINNLPYFSSEAYKDRLSTIFNEEVYTALNIFSYAIILFFIYLLYKSHKAISVTDSAKKLMESILRTRKVIKYYVIYNLVMVFAMAVAGTIYSINHDPKMANNFSHFSDKQLITFAVLSTVIIGVFLVLIWLFYKLIYGLLLKRLNSNYKELKKLEV